MIVALANSKGGVLKSTISVHLVDWFRIHGCSVTLVDCDAQRLSSRWLKVARPDIPVATPSTPEGILKEVPKLSEEFDAVVVDAPGGLSETTGAILQVADAALIPTGASYLDIMALDWTTETIHEIQKIREGLPQTAIIPSKVSRGRKTTESLRHHARSMRFGITEATIPFREILVQAAGLPGRDGEEWKMPPSLVWDIGRNKIVREAALELDAVFQEIFAGACQQDTQKVLKMVTPKSKLKLLEKEKHGTKIAANG